MTFRVDAKNFFLTYPQSTDLDHQYLHDHLTAFRGGAQVYSCRELHEDGSYHHHAIVSLPNKYNCKSERAFDLIYQGRNYHCNIGPVRNLPASNQYIAKNGETKGNPIRNAAQQRASPYADFLRDATNSREFMAMVRERDPKNFVLNNKRLKEFAAEEYGTWDEPFEPRYTEFNNVPDSLTTWVNEELNGGKDRPKCLILVGGPDLGKTSWARSLGPHHIWDNHFHGRSGRVKDAKYAVINDLDSYDKHADDFKGIWGSQGRVGVKIGNGVSGHTSWNWGIPTIWTFNPTNLPLRLANYNGYERMRNTYVEIDSPLY